MITGGLGILFYKGGEKIQEVVDKKSRIHNLPEATIVDFIYALILYAFKIWSNIPMSTTWCFVGLLSGREIALSYLKLSNRNL